MNDSSPPGSRRPASSSSGAPGKPAAGHVAGKIAGNVAIIVADLVGQGRDAVERGDIKAARRALDGATSRAPKDRDVMVLKALVLAADGDAEEALEVLDVAIDRFPDDVALVAHKAFILLDDIGDPEEALPLLQECLAILGGGGHDDDAGLDTELRLRLIDANLALGDVEAAIEAGRNAVAGAANADDVSDQAFARSSLARALMAAGDLPGARAEADLAVAGCPDNADVHAVLGRVACAGLVVLRDRWGPTWRVIVAGECRYAEVGVAAIAHAAAAAITSLRILASPFRLRALCNVFLGRLFF